MVLCSMVLVVACGHSPAAAPQKPAAKSVVDPIPQDRYADDVGRFLAGMPARTGSPFAKLQDTEAWKSHQREMDAAWNKVAAERLPAMHAFQKSELDGSSVAGMRVFYPFSGPDALTVTVFFPHSPIYVMVGLEPPGTLPGAPQLESKNLGAYLAATRATLDSEFDRSFFITRQMDREFRGQVTDGLCLPILELLARSGHTITGFRSVRLDEDAHIVARPANYRAPGRFANKGVEIEFRSDDDQSVHQLDYFSVNLADDRLQDNQAFLSYLSTLRGSATFLKATSYMLHRPGFAAIRRQVLEVSAAVLQDDSGVPYRFYAAPTWRVQLYGQYVRPYGSFRWLEQPDLRNAYLTQKPKPLPFRIGYGFHVVPSNLQFATRMN